MVAGTKAQWTLDRPIPLHSLAYRVDGDEVTIGRTDIDSYAVFPADGAQLVRELAAGATPREAAARYAVAHGSDVDLVDLLERLSELGFVRSADQSAAADGPVAWQRLGRALFSPVAWVGYGLLVACWVAAMVRSPDLVPQYHNIFFTDYYTLIVLALFLGQIPALLIHEGFHTLAGRRLGLRSRLSVGRRLYFIVFETFLDGLVMLPRRKRYLPILAGMLADVLVLAGLTLAAELGRHRDGALSFGSRLCLALAFAVLMRLAWQFYLYLQTDVYFLLATALGCEDLHRVAKGVLRNRWNRLLGHHDRLEPETSWAPNDRRVARWYSWLLVAGYTFSIASLAYAVLPVGYRVIRGLIDRLAHGDDTSGGRLIDSSVFLLLTISQLIVTGVLMRRDRRRRRQPSKGAS